MKVAVILPAAGMGTRMGKGAAEKTGTSRKQFMLLEGSPILMHTVRKFSASDRVGVIVVAFAFEVFLARPSAAGIASGFLPTLDGPDSILLAVGIIGATVMPHVIYLHSALTQQRVVGGDAR